MDTSESSNSLGLSRAYTLSLVIATVMGATSLAGLFLPANIYPNEELRRAFLANDLVNLLVGLPVLFGSLWSVRRGSLLGLLFWPGALFYVTYNSIAYAVAMPLTPSFWANLFLIVLSVFAIYKLLSGIDGSAVQSRIAGKVPERYIAGTLIGMGTLFFLMAASKLVSSAAGQMDIPWPEVAVQIADLSVTPAWIAGGFLLWQKRGLGYIVAAGLLFQISMLFVGLLVFFILQPLVAGVPFPAGDFVTVAAMGLVGFLPFGIFIRGAIST